MLTSLAPSPIAKVTFLGNLFLIMLTISAFYFGETRHARTTSTLSDAERNILRRLSLLSMVTREDPATIIAFLTVLDSGSSISFCTSVNLVSNSSTSFSSMMCYYIILSNNPADIPIFIAVSILSPVRTHTFIPTDFINWIVSETLS